MVAQKRKRDEYECDVVTFLRRGGISILEAIAVKLPDVFAAEILPKLQIKDTLNLAQVNKAYNDEVWSADGVRSLEAKIKTHFVKIGKKNWATEPLYLAARHGNGHSAASRDEIAASLEAEAKKRASIEARYDSSCDAPEARCMTEYRTVRWFARRPRH